MHHTQAQEKGACSGLTIGLASILTRLSSPMVLGAWPRTNAGRCLSFLTQHVLSRLCFMMKRRVQLVIAVSGRFSFSFATFVSLTGEYSYGFHGNISITEMHTLSTKLSLREYRKGFTIQSEHA